MQKILTCIVDRISLSFRRFAVTNLFALALAVMTLRWTREGGGLLWSGFMFLGVMIPVSASIQLLSERLKFGLWKKIALHVGFTVAIWFYVTLLWNADSLQGISVYGAFLVSLLLVVAIPYLWDREGLGRHILDLASRFFQSFFFMCALMIGLSFTLLTISMLFGISMEIETYADLGIILFLFLWPVVFFSLYPNVDDEPRKVQFIYRALFLYILLPLLLVYTVILYVYFLKIAFEMTYPENSMSNLIIWYLLVAVITMYFSRSIDGLQGEFARWSLAATRYFGYALMVPLALLFYSIGIRIATYGMTMPRYVLLMLSIFSLLSIFLLLWNHRLTQHLILGVAALLIMVMTTGYFSAYNVSLRSQLARFEAVYASEVERPLRAGKEWGELDPERVEQAADIYRYLVYDLDYDMSDRLDEDMQRVMGRYYPTYSPPYVPKDSEPQEAWTHYERTDSMPVRLSHRSWYLPIRGPESDLTIWLDENRRLEIQDDKLSIRHADEATDQVLDSIDLIKILELQNFDQPQVFFVLPLNNEKYMLTFIPETITWYQVGSRPKKLEYYSMNLLIEETP